MLFNHSIAINQATLEGAANIFNRYGGQTIPDFLDITWYKDEDWIWTFNQLLDTMNGGETARIYGSSSAYLITKRPDYYIIAEGDKTVAQIRGYTPNDLFLFLTTLLKGYYEY